MGRWAWFTNGVVTFKADGTLSHDPGNDGTWHCDDPTRSAITIRWRQGGFINHVSISTDGSRLSSTDPAQSYVTGRRLDRDQQGVASTAAPSSAVVLETQTDGRQTLAAHLPDLMKRATAKAQEWRRDAVPVALEYQYLDPPNPALKGPQIKLSFLAPSDGTGQVLTITPKGVSTFTFNQPVNWGRLSILPAFVDLPSAVRIATAHGARTPINGASLRVWSPGRHHRCSRGCWAARRSKAQRAR